MLEDPINVGDIEEVIRKIQWVNDQLLRLCDGGWERNIGAIGAGPLHK